MYIFMMLGWGYYALLSVYYAAAADWAVVLEREKFNS